MKLSEWIVKQQEMLETEGDLNVYVGDMKEPRLGINETVDAEDAEIYGKNYLTIEH